MKIWILALALALPGPVIACEYLTQHYELCPEGTPWANGRWENGGDSATLYVGKIGYEGFEDYRYHDPDKTIYQEMDDRTQDPERPNVVVALKADRLAAQDMAFVRVIERVTSDSFGTEVWVTMFAEDTRDAPNPGARILLQLRAPADTPVDKVDRLSREFAALVWPRKNVGGQ
jgi:hypothetical protein